MVLVDAICPACRTVETDLFVDAAAPVYPECVCGVPMVRSWAVTAIVRPDSIPGGLLIEHGLCHEDGTPRRFDSQSEITAACAAKGLTRWTDIYEERATKDGRVYGDWLQSGEAQQARRERVDARRMKGREY